MPSFDVVSKVDLQEVDNALNQAKKEIAQRFDFRGTETDIEQTPEGIALRANSEGRIQAAFEVLQQKFVKRHISLKALDVGKIEPGAKGNVKQLVKLKQGIVQDKAREIVKLIKESKLKVQAAIQADTVRVSGKSRDDLQSVMQLLRGAGIDLDLQFENFRD